jgi:hypothetical protein
MPVCAMAASLMHNLIALFNGPAFSPKGARPAAIVHAALSPPAIRSRLINPCNFFLRNGRTGEYP